MHPKKLNILQGKKEKKGLIKQVIAGILFSSTCFQAIGVIQCLALPYEQQVTSVHKKLTSY